jgi:hypothetical protein
MMAWKPPILEWALSEGRVRPPCGLPKRGLGQVLGHLGRGYVSKVYGFVNFLLEKVGGNRVGACAGITLDCSDEVVP